MPYDPKQPPEEKKSLIYVIAHSFFVVPFLIAVFAILLFASVRLLTMEKHSASDYLKDVQEGGLTKRWQSAFELSRVLAQRSKEGLDEDFVAQLSQAFEKSKNDDERVYQYLALAMARSGDQRFTQVLLQNIDNEKNENLYAIITSLGILADVKAVDVLLKYLKHDNPRIRLAAVISLGQVGDVTAVPPLKAMLEDAEINVVWDAAIALSKLGDQSAKGIIKNLLDRKYLSEFKEVDDQEQAKIMGIAIQVSYAWQDPEIIDMYKNLSQTDKNMNVRNLAFKALNQKL